MNYIFIALAFILMVAFLSKPKPTKEQREFLNRVRWQREVYGFEFYVSGSPESGLGMGKHLKHATKEQRDRLIKDRRDDTIQESYEKWKRDNNID